MVPRPDADRLPSLCPRAQVETALGNAERQIERLRAREAAHGSALAETRRALRATRDDAASSAMSEDGVAETGARCTWLPAEVLHAFMQRH